MNTTLQPNSNTRLRRISSRLIYLPICLATTWIAAFISARYFQFDYSPLGILSTALILAAFFAALAPALRGPLAGSLLSLLLSLLLLTGHAVKIAAMRTPLQIADIAAIPLLFRTLTGFYLGVGITLIGVTIAIVALAIRWQKKSLWAFAAAAIYIFALVSTSNIWLETVATRLDIKQDIQERQAFDLEHRTSNLHRHLREGLNNRLGHADFP